MAAANSADPKERSVEVVASTGSAVLRSGMMPDGHGYGLWRETLDVRHADLRRFVGAPVLLDHVPRSANVVGTVTAASIKNGAIHARLKFGRSPLASEIFDDVSQGLRSNVSIGYIADDWKHTATVGKIREYTPKSFTLIELSLVPIGADENAKVRSIADETNGNLMRRGIEIMTLENSHNTEAVTGDDDSSVEAVQAERARVLGVQAAARSLNLTNAAEVGDLIENGTPLADAKRALVDLAAARSAATSNRPRVNNGYDAPGVTGPGGTRDAISRALAHRMLPSIAVDASSEPYVRMTLSDMERAYNAAGSMTRSGGFGMQTQSDLAHLVGDATRMVLAQAYAVVKPPLLPAARLVQVRDFQPVSVLRPTVGPTLLDLGEHAEVKFGPVESGREIVQTKTVARDFGFTRQLVVGDAVGALADFATMSARAAAQTLGTLLTAALTSNPAMSDGTPFFHANHGNLAAAGTILNLAALEAAMIAIRSQVDDGQNVIGVTPKWLVVGPRREVQGKQLLAQIAAAEPANVNVYSGDLQCIVDPRLTGYEWFVLGDAAINPALAFIVLDGTRKWSTLNGVPEVEVSEHPNALGLRVRIYADFNAQPLDWRAAYRNAGAAS